MTEEHAESVNQAVLSTQDHCQHLRREVAEHRRFTKVRTYMYLGVHASSQMYTPTHSCTHPLKDVRTHSQLYTPTRICTHSDVHTHSRLKVNLFQMLISVHF